MDIDRDLWPAIRQHTWKWTSDRVDVRGIIWHATRSGLPGRTAAVEFESACNWFLSPNNRTGGEVPYGGMSHYIIGGGRVARCVPEELVPHYSAGVHDRMAISVEVGQGTNSDRYEERDIELCRELAAELSARYGFPLVRIPFVGAGNQGWPGMVGHEDTAQGRGQGKSDPGPLFWTAWEDLAMTDPLVERLIVALFGDSSERTLPWAERVDVASYRMDRRVDLEDPPGSGLLMPLAEFCAILAQQKSVPHEHSAEVTSTVRLNTGGVP